MQNVRVKADQLFRQIRRRFGPKGCNQLSYNNIGANDRRRTLRDAFFPHVFPGILYRRDGPLVKQPNQIDRIGVAYGLFEITIHPESLVDFMATTEVPGISTCGVHIDLAGQLFEFCFEEVFA